MQNKKGQDFNNTLKIQLNEEKVKGFLLKKPWLGQETDANITHSM